MTRPARPTPGPQIQPEDLATTVRRPRGSIRTTIHRVVEGEIPWSVSAPDVYAGEEDPPMTHQYGAEVTVFKDKAAQTSFYDKAAQTSFYDSCRQYMAKYEAIYPDLEAEQDRQDRERSLLNGGPTVLERKMQAAHRDAEMAETQGVNGNIKLAQAWQARQRAAAKVPYRQIAQMGREHGWELTNRELTDIRVYASGMPLSEHRQLREKTERSRIDQIAMELLGFDEPVIEPAKPQELGAVVAQEGASL